MIWGLSFALHEEAITDRRTGRIMNADLAEYHVPVNADVPSLEAILVPEEDAYVNPLGVKGVGEIGITGTVGRHRQRGLARDRRARPALPDPHRGPHSPRTGLNRTRRRPDGLAAERRGSCPAPRFAVGADLFSHWQWSAFGRPAILPPTTACRPTRGRA